MAHLQYMPGDPRLVDQLVYELKSKGIFDQFRKECIADVDTRPAYQNLRQRVESSVSTFLSRQCWKPDLNKNQLREKLRKHILDGNYLEQGVERIVDQVVNPKVASVFIPQVEDLVYNYLGITRKKAPVETAEKIEDLLPTDLEAVSPGSVKSNDDKDDKMEIQDELEPMEVDQDVKEEIKEEVEQKPDVTEVKEGVVTEKNVPVLAEEFILYNIPEPTDSPPKTEQDKPVSKEVSLCDIPLPEDVETETTFKPIQNSEDSNSSSGSSLRRNMSPLTPIRNYTNENSCDAQQGFDNDSDCKEDKEPSSFCFSIESNDVKEKTDKKDTEPDLSYQFNQVNINAFNTPMYDDSSNSNLLRIDYESDTNSKNVEKPEMDSEDSKKDRRDDRKSHKSSHRSRDSHRHSSSTDKRSDSKHSSSRDSSRHDKKPSSTKDDHKRSSKDNRDRSKDRDRKDSRDSSKHRSSSSSQKSSRDHRDSKSHRSSSSNHKSSSSKTSEKKSSSTSSSREKDKSESRDKSSKDKDRKDSKSRSDKDHRSDKDRKSKKDEKDKKKDKKDIDDHYSSSGRGNNGRRSTDRDSNDGSSSSKGSQNQNGSKTAEGKKETKNNSSKSDNTSPSGESTSPSDKEVKLQDTSKQTQFKPVRVENLETPIAKPPRLPFVPDVTLKKPKFAANFEEAKKMMKMRKFLDEEQKRMNQEAALLLEFQANVRPSLSQVYSSIPGPELEFVCGSNTLITNTACEIDTQTKTDTDFDSDTQKNDKFAVPRVVIERCAKIDNVSKDVEEKTLDVKESECKVEESIEEIQRSIIESSPSHIESSSQNEMKAEVSYDENKPFSTLMDEISEYSKASEIKSKENEVKNSENIDKNVDNAEIDDSNEELTDLSNEIIEDKTLVNKTQENNIESQNEGKLNKNNIELNTDSTVTTETRNFEITIIAEEIDDTDEIKPNYELKYFSNEEQETAETEKDEFNTFLKQYIGSFTNNRIYLINCDTYEENIIKEVAASFGDYEIVNYYKNGNLKLPNTSKNIVKDIPLTEELSLPMESIDYDRSPIFSPAKSECSFDLSSDYDARLNEIVNKKSRQEVLEIILGSVLEDTSEASVDLEYTDSLKRKMDDDVMVDINRSVLTPTKVRKLSDSDQISSTTEDQEDEVSNNNKPNTTRSKYLGKARRVGLPKPKRCNLVNSPSSDKSVENYVQNARPSSPQPPNGKLKLTPRSKVQRYDTSDLYKPKLHYLSRRNNIS